MFNTIEQYELELNRQIVSLEAHMSTVNDELHLLVTDPIIKPTPTILNNYSAESILIDVVNANVSMESIGEKLKRFSDSIAKGLGYVQKLLANIIATGFPLIRGLIKKAEYLKQQLPKADVRVEEFKSSNIAKAITIGAEVLKPEDLTLQLEHLVENTTLILGPQKLKQFEEMSSRMLEPYRNSAKSKGRTDELVFVLGVVAGLTNPAVVVGEVLKQLSVIVAPNSGKSIDAVTTVVGMAFPGGMVKGIASVLPTIGSHSASTLRDWSNGRMDISVLPNYREELYPFCTEQMPNDKTFFETYRSKLMLGNAYFQVTDYKRKLTPELKGSKNKVGAKFKQAPVKLQADAITTLDKEQVDKVLDNIIELLTTARAYSLSFKQQTKAYINQYNQISDIVMSINDDSNLRGTYVRHSYRTAMNQVVGSLWNDCMGSDIKYIRYLISTCKYLLRYCERSITVTSSSED